MDIAQKIMQAVAGLVEQEQKGIFSNQEIRTKAGIRMSKWYVDYNHIFQAMRADGTDKANIGQQFQHIFQQCPVCEERQYLLTEKGWQLLDELQIEGR